MRTRAERRVKYVRLKDRRINERYWGRGRGPHHWDARQLGISVDTPHPCSCLFCGNRRRFEGQTRRAQERGEAARRPAGVRRGQLMLTSHIPGA